MISGEATKSPKEQSTTSPHIAPLFILGALKGKRHRQVYREDKPRIHKKLTSLRRSVISW